MAKKEKITHLTVLALLVGVLGLTCSTVANGSAKREVPDGAQLVLQKGDARVGTYTSSTKGFETSSYWLEGPTGLIFIDTQFLLSAGEEALNWAERATGKKVELAIVLHPNPDKFNGTGIYQKRGIRVVTSDQVRELIPAVHKLRHGWFYDRYKPDYPNDLSLPESFGKATTELSAGGIKVTAHVLGKGCSNAHVVVEFEGHLFPGDLVTNLNHSWLELGLVDEWLKRVAELQELEPDYVHPGRGVSGGAELLDRQELYLKTVQRLVKNAKPRLPPNEKKAEAIVEKLQELYPGYGFVHFIHIGIPEVMAEQAKLNKQTTSKLKKN